MNIRYGKLFKLPRQIIKHLLSAIYPIVIKIWPLPKVESIPNTINKIIKDKVSICRFGDGELLYVSEKRSLPFQKQNERLRSYLISILSSKHNHILVGMPVGFYSLENLKKDAKITWRAVIAWTYPRIYRYLDHLKQYYNASMTRFYIEYENKSHCDEWFKKVRSIWDDKNILLKKGEKAG
jgi:hypothetical protein